MLEHTPHTPPEQPKPDPRAEQLMRAHNLMQYTLIEQSGMDPIEWIDTYAEDFRDIATISDSDTRNPETLSTKQAIEQACLDNDIPTAVRLMRTLHHFPYRAAA